MQLSDLLSLKGKTRFRLRLELTVVVFGLLGSQALLLKVPALELLVTLLVVLYISAVAKELKTRCEPFTRKQKHILFGLVAFVYGAVLAALLVAGIVKRTPLVWIVFGLAAVLSFVILIHDHEQLYKDGDSA
jgi:uncharacterized membrane protein